MMGQESRAPPTHSLAERPSEIVSSSYLLADCRTTMELKDDDGSEVVFVIAWGVKLRKDNLVVRIRCVCDGLTTPSLSTMHRFRRLVHIGLH